MRILALLSALAMLGGCTTPADAGRLVDVTIVSRAARADHESYYHRGKNFVVGNPGERYAVRLRNRTNERVLVVLSVDGVNVVSGETADPAQSGYVLGPYESAEIAGWRKNLREVAEFYFTALPDSYAARTDRPQNVGVIGAAVFRERRHVVAAPLAKSRAADAVNEAPAAPAAEAMGSASGEVAAQRKAERLGTGHSAREYAPTEYTEFVRRTASPAEIIAIYYDSRANLIARGVIRRAPRYVDPQPFPDSFVPDPPNNG
jgi:hypothetical protein